MLTLCCTPPLNVACLHTRSHAVRARCSSVGLQIQDFKRDALLTSRVVMRLRDQLEKLKIVVDDKIERVLSLVVVRRFV